MKWGLHMGLVHWSNFPTGFFDIRAQRNIDYNALNSCCYLIARFRAFLHFYIIARYKHNLTARVIQQVHNHKIYSQRVPLDLTYFPNIFAQR